MTALPIKRKSDIRRLSRHLLETCPRDYALFILAINTGLRYQQLSLLRVVDLKALTVGDALTVTGNRPDLRVSVTVNIAIIDAVKILLDAFAHYHDTEPVFQGSIRGLALSDRSAHELVKSWGRFLNLPGSLTTLSLRKTYAYHRYKHAGVPLSVIQKELGHKSETQTRQYLGLVGADTIDYRSLTIELR